MSALDLTLFSLYRINGQEWPQLPGLLAQNPPKKPARGREQDRLIVYLTLAGNILYSSTEYTQIVGQVAETFYNTPGSVTFALKSAAEALNAFLVERNMRTTSKGQYSIGALVLGALRNNLLFIVQCGPTHVYQMGPELHHFYDSQLAGKGLGLSQTTRLYLAQAQLNHGDKLLFCAAMPPNWEKTINEGRGHGSLESTKRRLMAVTDTNVTAVLIQAVEGSGAMNIFKPAKEIPAEPVQPAASAPQQRPANQPEPTYSAPTSLPASGLPLSKPDPSPQPPAAFPEPVSFAAEMPAPETASPPRGALVSSQSAQASSLPQASTSPQRPFPIPPATPEEAPEIPPSPRRRSLREREYSPEPKVLITPEQREQFRQRVQNSARFMAQGIQRGRELWEKAVAALGKLIPHLLPSDDEASSSFLMRAWPAFIAVLVPILVVTIAVTIYNAWGKPLQADQYVQQAQASRQQAQNEPDPNYQREHWETVLSSLDEADQYTDQPNETSRQLRQEAQAALDALNRVTRIDFRPALSSPLSEDVNITVITASDNDVYLLDAGHNKVMRGVYNGQGSYDLDPGFQCSPNEKAYDGIQVGLLIDIIALPRTNPSAATLMGVDAGGNLIYCIPGEAPRGSFLQRPESGWNRLTSVAYDANNLYVLDASSRAVWVYFGDLEAKFPSKPFFFFESQVPNDLEKAIDMAVNGDDLYLLYADGHLTTCTLSRISASPTRCNDPATFIDTRPGFQNGPKVAEFSQIAFTTPPDPSVALLHPYTQSIFRFSARALELQKQLQPWPGQENPLPQDVEIRAMAFSPNKSLFIYVGKQLYFAVNVP